MEETVSQPVFYNQQGENDFDFALLTEYLFDEDVTTNAASSDSDSGSGNTDISSQNKSFSNKNQFDKNHHAKTESSTSITGIVNNINPNINNNNKTLNIISNNSYNNKPNTSSTIISEEENDDMSTDNLKSFPPRYNNGDMNMNMNPNSMNEMNDGLAPDQMNQFDDEHLSADRRRERNRVLARKTRLRKKFFFESLQRQVAQLAKENEMLKDVVKTHISQDAKERILADCSTEIPAIVSQTASQANSLLEKSDFGLMSAIQAAQRSFCISDPSLPDNPIVFASQGFLDLTGYQLNEVLGRNCRFLQGPETDQAEVLKFREAIMRGEDTSISLINYKADGTKFRNQIFTAALRDSNNKVVNYVGVQVEVKPVDESKRFEDEAILALPAAKKGRPRTKNRDVPTNTISTSTSSISTAPTRSNYIKKSNAVAQQIQVSKRPRRSDGIPTDIDMNTHMQMSNPKDNIGSVYNSLDIPSLFADQDEIVNDNSLFDGNFFDLV